MKRRQRDVERKEKHPLFRVVNPSGITIETSHSYWRVIARLKHPSIAGKEEEVKETLRFPDEVRRSVKSGNVFLYYKRYGKRFLCVVARHRGKTGFVITAYVTKRVKEGKVVWQKNKEN